MAQQGIFSPVVTFSQLLGVGRDSEQLWSEARRRFPARRSSPEDGALTLGDSHEYDLGVDVFDRSEINKLILDFARRHVRVPVFEIAQFWHGVYAKHDEAPYIRYSPIPDVHGIIVTSGIGMTLAFGLAEKTLQQIGVTG